MSDPPRIRSIHFLTPEQLKKKREGDRLAQRQRRERTKADIETLRRQVHDLQQRNQALEDRLCCIEGPQQPPPGKRDQAQPEHAENVEANRNDTRIVAPDFPLPNVVIDRLSAESFPNQAPYSTAEENDGPGSDIGRMLHENVPGLDFTLWTGVYNEDNLAGGLPFDHTAFDWQSLTSDNDTTSPSSFQTIATDYVWAAIPRHTAPTCLLDHVLFDLTRQRRKQDNANEFHRSVFPSIQSLLNPSSEQQAKASPVTFTIVNKIIRVMTVPTLPEQIAILYVMSSVVRWLISPTEANYDAMPEWLRPGASQLAVPHPPWLDLLPWPRVRERLCRWPKYHGQHALVSAICNESLAINWPYHSADIILQCNSGDAVLNPIFDRHIKNIANWTIGKKLLVAFPELEGEVNVK